jgi:hypothetical protein
MTECGIYLMLTRANVELPAMPGTRYDLALESAFAQRTTLVRADAIQRVNLVFHVE